MRLKRCYDEEKNLTHVKILSKKRVQKFSTRFVQEQILSGLISIADKRISIKTAEGEDDVVYYIVSGPGYYCCHTNKKLESEKAAKAHIEKNFKGVKSPDPNNPAGYRKDDCFTCVLDGTDLDPEKAEAEVQASRQKLFDRIAERKKS